MRKKLLSAIIIFSIIILTGCNLETVEEPTNSTKIVEQEQTTNKDKQNNKEYMDALRKCSVMEAADIYTTGVGKKSDNVFDDGKKTCEAWNNQWGEKDFIDTINEEWENRKNEEIDGKPLTYYLDILGW